MNISTSKWLDAIYDRNVALHTLQSCLTLCDLQCDGYYKLVVADIPHHKLKLKSTLKVYKGSRIIAEQLLPGIPSAVQSFYIDEQEPKIPIIAVAIGPSVLFYRNLKPYYKFTVPSSIVEPLEKDIWIKLATDRQENQENLIDTLKSLDISRLTWRSQKLLQIPISERKDYINGQTDIELEKLSIITAMTTLQRLSSDIKSPSCLILATESGEILIIDTLSFLIIYEAKTCSFETAPSLISASGQFDTDFRIVIATREGSLCLLRKTWLEGRQILKLEQPIISLALLPIDQTIATICLNNNLTCYSKKGKKLWSVELASMSSCMVPIPLPHLGITLICIALRNGQVQLYYQKYLVDEFKVEDEISAMIFGRLGQEEHVLTIITENCSLLIKILKRTAEFNPNKNTMSSNSSLKNTKELNIPKKNAIFIEQSLREKDNLKVIYNTFQAEMWRLRLTAARTTLDTIDSGESTISDGIQHAPIKLSAEVEGSGPEFILFLTIESMSTKENMSTANLSVLLHADHNHYTLTTPIAKLPPLFPGIPLRMDFEIIAVLDPNDGLPPSDLTVENSFIRVMIVEEDKSKPLIAAIVSMPQSEGAIKN